MRQFFEEPFYAVVELTNRRCQGLKLMEDLGITQCILLDIRGIPGGVTRHLIRFPSNQIKKIPANASFEVMVRNTRNKEVSVWFDSEGCDVCKTILSNNSFLLSGRKAKDYTVIYSFVAPSAHIFKKIISTLEDHGLELKILEAGKLKTKGKTLTEKQDRALWLALKMGFFDYPRKVNLSELSQRLGIAPSTLSESIRRGIRKLLEERFET